MTYLALRLLINDQKSFYFCFITAGLMENYPKMYLYRCIVQAKLFIDNNYADRIDLSQIADEAFFSRFHFRRLFKQAYGKTPHHYLT